MPGKAKRCRYRDRSSKLFPTPHTRRPRGKGRLEDTRNGTDSFGCHGKVAIINILTNSTCKAGIVTTTQTDHALVDEIPNALHVIQILILFIKKEGLQNKHPGLRGLDIKNLAD